MEVKFVYVERETSPRFLEDRFTLQPDRGHVWLQKAALFVLRRLGCYAQTEDVTYKRATVDTDKFVDAIHRQRREVISRHMRTGGRLLIGPREFSELLGEIEPTRMLTSRMLSFDASYDVGRDGRVTVFGLPVTVIPWMEGMLVVPTDDEMEWAR